MVRKAGHSGERTRTPETGRNFVLALRGPRERNSEKLQKKEGAGAKEPKNA